MKKDLNYYLNLPYVTILKMENEHWVAYHEEYPNVIGVGNNEAEAIQTLKDAFTALIKSLLADGEKIKEPKKRSKKWYDENFYNETNVRLIKESYERLKNGDGIVRN
ncbi:MAG: hypothetical protein IJ211_05420 [Campylobacter sp.]|nr:hypothetical protein [Campylobacter sp.]